MKHIKSILGKTTREYPKGQILLYQGERADTVFHIESGYVKVKDITGDGNNKVVSILGPGDVYPLVWTLKHSYKLIYFYEAMTDVQLRFVSQKNLTKHVQSNHPLTIDLFEYFVEKTRQLMLRIEALEAVNAKYKIIQVFSYLKESHSKILKPDVIEIIPPLTHQDIADMSGLARETASMQIKLLENEGIIDQDNGLIRINENKLKKILETE